MRSIRVGRVLGIELRVDWSILVIFGLLTWDFAVLALPKIVPGYSSAMYWGVAAPATVAFLATLAAHEMSHCFVARRRGISVRDITLWMLGGTATIEGTPNRPRDEFEIAIAGPALSAALGILGTVAGIACAAAGAPRIVAAAILWVAMFNVVLAVFNLAPAAPLDGGRILRAWLWHRSGDRALATVKAARAGEVFAWILLAAGLAELTVGGEVGGLWMLVVGWFVLHAARGEHRQGELERRRRPVGQHAPWDTSPGHAGTLCSRPLQPSQRSMSE